MPETRRMSAEIFGLDDERNKRFFIRAKRVIVIIFAIAIVATLIYEVVYQVSNISSMSMSKPVSYTILIAGALALVIGMVAIGGRVGTIPTPSLNWRLVGGVMIIAAFAVIFWATFDYLAMQYAAGMSFFNGQDSRWLVLGLLAALAVGIALYKFKGLALIGVVIAIIAATLLIGILRPEWISSSSRQAYVPQYRTAQCPGGMEEIPLNNSWRDINPGHSCRVIARVKTGAVIFRGSSGETQPVTPAGDGGQDMVYWDAHASTMTASVFVGRCPLQYAHLKVGWDCEPLQQ